MEKHIILIVAVSCLFSLSSGSFYVLNNKPNPANNPQANVPRGNTVILPPSFANLYNHNNNGKDYTNDNIDNNNNFVEPTAAPSTQKPSVTDVNSRCVQKAARDFRAHPHDCGKFSLCSAGTLIRFECPTGSVFHKESKSCVPKGSIYDKCKCFTK